MEWISAAAAGTAAGILSGFGVGGGTLLLVYMSVFAGLEQHLAQCINLLYFIPSAGASLPSHIRNGYIDKAVVLPAALSGLLFNAAGSWIAVAVDTVILRRCFGAFLLVIGTRELVRKKEG